MPKPVLDSAQVAQFQRDGFLIVHQLLDRDEADILRQAARADAAFKQTRLRFEGR